MRKLKFVSVSLLLLTLLVPSAFAEPSSIPMDPNVSPAAITKNQATMSSDPSQEGCRYEPLSNGERIKSCVGPWVWKTLNKKVEKYDSLPLTDQHKLISVAKGQKQKLAQSFTQSKKITSIEPNVTSAFELASIYSILTGKNSDTITEPYDTSKEYDGPDPSSPYNTREYYTAVGYDEYKLDITLTYFWFKSYQYFVPILGVWVDRAVEHNQFYDAGLTHNLTIQLPKIVTYSVDVNR
ncbi:hypothetical protein YDYSG_32220 [Paenibacillus tyrfis]|uniref:hypothetical protein n=1 Tax=Paenibacillus tyrfis TaxID=1501230 RepID=UPI0024907CAE|nr:hypothetical protein [Paenibacillus tyrfis]GLI07192.1 hypothetical protein YDYSG_32220 [Paenibacillus tyrfis]